MRLKGPSAYEIMESHFGGASGAAGSGVNGTINFKHNGQEYTVSRDDLPGVLKEIFRDKFDQLEGLSNDESIEEEYGFDIWIDGNGELQSNDVAARNSGNANYYFPDIPDGMTYLSTAHTHWGMDGTFSADDLNAPLRITGGTKDINLFVGYVVHRDGISAYTFSYDHSSGANSVDKTQLDWHKKAEIVRSYTIDETPLNDLYRRDPSGVFNAWNNGIQRYFQNNRTSYQLYIFNHDLNLFIKK